MTERISPRRFHELGWRVPRDDACRNFDTGTFAMGIERTGLLGQPPDDGGTLDPWDPRVGRLRPLGHDPKRIDPTQPPLDGFRVIRELDGQSAVLAPNADMRLHVRRDEHRRRAEVRLDRLQLTEQESRVRHHGSTTVARFGLDDEVSFSGRMS